MSRVWAGVEVLVAVCDQRGEGVNSMRRLDHRHLIWLQNTEGKTDIVTTSHVTKAFRLRTNGQWATKVEHLTNDDMWIVYCSISGQKRMNTERGLGETECGLEEERMRNREGGRERHRAEADQRSRGWRSKGIISQWIREFITEPRPSAVELSRVNHVSSGLDTHTHTHTDLSWLTKQCSAHHKSTSSTQCSRTCSNFSDNWWASPLPGLQMIYFCLMSKIVNLKRYVHNVIIAKLCIFI